jgi:hypothetical protein
VFALGDVVSGALPNIKTAKMQHPPVVAGNIIALATGKVASSSLSSPALLIAILAQTKLKAVKPLPGFIQSFFIVVVGSAGTVSNSLLGALLASTKHKDFILENNISEYSDKHAASPVVAPLKEEDL